MRRSTIVIFFLSSFSIACSDHTGDADAGREVVSDGARADGDGRAQSARLVVSELASYPGENGATGTFTIALASEPMGDVTIGIVSSDPSEGTATPDGLVFRAEDWDVPRTVTIAPVDDDELDGPVPYTIVVSVSASTDPTFAGIPRLDLPIHTVDDDVAGYVYTSFAGSLCDVVGSARSFDVVLTARPSATVTIPVSVTGGLAQVMPSTVVFAPDAWNEPKRVTVTSTGTDVFAQSDVQVVLAPPTTSDIGFGASDPDDVTLSLCDHGNDAVLVRAVGGATVANPLVTNKGGAQAQFEITLAAQPSADVVLALDATTANQVTIAPTSITFTSGNWNVARTVTLTGRDDGSPASPTSHAIVLDPSSADPGYDAIASTMVSVRNDDIVTNVALNKHAYVFDCPKGQCMISGSAPSTVDGLPETRISIVSDDRCNSSATCGPATMRIDLGALYTNPEITISCTPVYSSAWNTYIAVPVLRTAPDYTQFRDRAYTAGVPVVVTGEVRFVELIENQVFGIRDFFAMDCTEVVVRARAPH